MILTSMVSVETASADMTSAIVDGEIVTDEYTIMFHGVPGTAVPTVKDRVFLLSVEEAYRYFTDDAARKCSVTPYCNKQEAYSQSDFGTCYWWLRSPGSFTDYASCVDLIGGVDSDGCKVDYIVLAVRPALWIDTSIPDR